MSTITARKLIVTAVSWKGEFYEFEAWEFENGTVMLPNSSEPDEFYAGRPDRFFANRGAITTFDNDNIAVETVTETSDTSDWQLESIKTVAQNAANYYGNYYSCDKAQLFLNWLNQR